MEFFDRSSAGVTKSPSGDFTGGRPRCADDADVRRLLEHWIRAGTTPQRLVYRSRIILLMLDGLQPSDIATRLGVANHTVKLWCERFRRGGADALLHDAPGRGRHPLLNFQTMKARLQAAELLDPEGRPVSHRRAAALLGVSTTAVSGAVRRGEPAKSSRDTSTSPAPLIR